MSLFSLIIIGIGAMLLLAFGIVFFIVLYQRRVIRHQQEIKEINDKKQQELIQASIQGEEEERMRIAAELHDDVGAMLSSVRLFLHAAARKDMDPTIITQSKELLDDSIRNIRNISHKLQPALLQQLGLQASLESFATMISNSANIQMSFFSRNPLPRFTDGIELSIYRIIQELTSNIIRHSEATAITVEIMPPATYLETVVIHNGKGLTDEMYQELLHKKGSIGLKNIMNRLKTINASISFTKISDAQFSTVIRTPLPAEIKK